MKIFTCKDRLEDIMTCIYDAWSEALLIGHDQIQLKKEPVFQQTIFDEYIHVDQDLSKAEKVIRSIRRDISDEAYLNIYLVTLSVEEDALQAIKAGVTGQEIHAVAQNVFQDAGYGPFFGHGLGHCVGLEIHEEPRFSPKIEEIIQENMVITVEPGLYLPNWGGVRIEDLVVVRKDGCMNLTHSPKDLIIL